jgi:hypothetical protein
MSDSELPIIPTTTSLSKPTVGTSYLVASLDDLHLTVEERQEIDSFNEMNVILGPAAGAALVCPGNQLDIPEEKKCPYAAKCPLLRMQKAPQNRICPIEKNYIEERFSAWAREVGSDPLALSETDRVAIADLTWLDTQVNRCNNILSAGENARLVHKNITEATVLEGQQSITPLTWEFVIHSNAELLASLQERRMIILKNWMLTPQEKFKRDRALGIGKGNDISSQQSSRADRLRKVNQIEG